MKRLIAYTAALIFLGIRVPAQAENIFTFVTTASGEVGSQSFTGATVTITGSYDPSAIFALGGAYGASTEFIYTISGIGSFTSTSTGDTVYASPSGGYVGIYSTYEGELDQFQAQSPSLLGYELAGSLGPIAATQLQAGVSGDSTSGGTLSFGPGSGAEVTFAPAATSATPEPSGLVLLGTGIVGAAGMARRKFLKK